MLFLLAAHKSSSAEKAYQNERKAISQATSRLSPSCCMYAQARNEFGLCTDSLQGYHVQVTARSDRDLTPEGIIQKVADASGSKYSGGGASMPSVSSVPPPPAASKPAFTPTRVGGGGSGFNALGSRSRVTAPSNNNVDEDGWGADAPPVTRTQLEKVQSAYKPTRVNMSELTSQKQEPSRFSAPRQEDNGPRAEVVKGAYQPIGKVDIAAIRRQAKESGTAQDDRPMIVKGAYEPVGKVDVAAIRARAQGPGDATSPPTAPSPAATGASGRSDDDAPKSLAERSAAFAQSERLTSLPKPKVASKFGSSTNFTGTKAPTPGGFQSKPTPAAAPVGAASRTFADQGGKTPAQLWAERKARERGLSGASDTAPPGAFPTPTSPIASQASGGGGWKSGYTGKSWAPVPTDRTGQSVASRVSEHRTGQEEQQDDVPTSPVGGVSAMRDRFKGAPPMGGPAASRAVEGDHPPAPPRMDMGSKPNAGAGRGVPMPGLPTRPARPAEEADEEEGVPAEEHVRIPTPPAQPRSPTPPTPPAMRPSSPIRVAMPVGRGRQPEFEAPEERFSPPPMPVQSISQAVSAAKDIPEEPQVEDDDPARGASEAVAAASFGAAATHAGPGASVAGKRALIQYDYEKAEDNEIDLKEGEYVTNIEMVDEDWWMGQNSEGETGLFPSNYVELVKDKEVAPAHARAPDAVPAAATPPAAPPASRGSAQGPTATALYDYEAAEDNELSFPDGAKIASVVSAHVCRATRPQRRGGTDYCF